MDQEIDLEEILEPSPDCCIYRIPQHLRKINEEAYTPRLISIGPLHYGRKELMGMESQKRRYWSKFCQRQGVNEEKLHEFKTYIENQEQCIRNHYSVTSTLRSSKYVEIVLYDAVFIIELILRKHHDIDDFLLKTPLRVSIERDLLLLENQLPCFVLHNLYTKAFPNNAESLFVLFLKYFIGSDDLSFLAESYSNSKHFTDFFRFFFIEGKPLTENSNGVEIYDLPCATKLNKSGLKFKVTKNKLWLGISLDKKKKYGKWFPWFEANELQIPAIPIGDSMESLLRNLMAFEMFHYPTETHICHYAFLLDRLIDTKEDVDLLVGKGIIVNGVGDNEAVAKMFNKLGSYIILSHDSCYNDIAKQLKAHYNYPWNHVKATLKSVYFSDLWTGTATVAATLFLILTLMQTVCSVMQVI